ncbi:MAG: DNA repair protein RecO [Flavobacteriaceae bacterium]
METTEALVIQTLKYGDSSLIAHCYTLRHGLQSYMLKGILSAKRKNVLPKSYFQPLSLLEIEAPLQPPNRLGYIKEARVSYSFQKLPFVIVKSTMALFLAEILFQVLQEEAQPNPDLFHFLKQSMIILDQSDRIGFFHLVFLIQLSNYMGFFPLIENEHHPFFDLQNGCTTAVAPTQHFLEGSLKNTWVTLCGMKFDNEKTIQCNKSDKKRLLEQLLLYYQIHLQRFKMPKSLPVLHELFQ